MLGLIFCSLGSHDWNYRTEVSGRTKRSCHRCIAVEELVPDYSTEFADYRPMGGPHIIGAKWERVD